MPTLEQVRGWQRLCNVFGWRIAPWGPAQLKSERYRHFLGPAMLLLENTYQQSYGQSHYICRSQDYF